METLREKIHKIPKTDVHNHLHLGGSIKAIRKRYSSATINIPKNYEGFDGMMAFIINNVNTIMLSSKDVLFLMETAITSSIDDNVHYLEASVDLKLSKFFDNSIEKFIDEVYNLKNKFSSQIDFRPDIGINKDSSLDKVYSDGLKCINSGVFNGIDLYGKESNQKLNDFLEIYNQAKNNNLKTKVHIGEFSNCQSIEDVISLFKPDEIQHGITAAGSKKTMNAILNNNIQLNICPQSNISLQSVKSISEHPIRKLYDHGIKITINTDDLLIFDATITDQCVALVEHNVFSFEEIEGILKNGFH